MWTLRRKRTFKAKEKRANISLQPTPPQAASAGAATRYIPEKARWEAIRQKTAGLGQALTDAVRAMARENPRLAGVIDMVDFNATAAGQRIISDDHLRALIEVLSRQRLGLDDVEPDILGRAYEYLLRKFAEGQGQSAGEFYTPREVGILMARLLEPEPGMTVYDPACGSGGLLSNAICAWRSNTGSPRRTQGTQSILRIPLCPLRMPRPLR